MSLSPSRELLAGRYRLDKLLGTGGMGDVHRAWDTRLSRFVAVKLFRSTLDPTAARRFDSEVQTLASLSHPALVSVYDAGTSESTPFVVLQLVEGRTLHDRIGDGPLTPDQVRELGARLADALAYVHAHDVVHRDIKPSNILLDTAETAYLADFGLARLTGATRLTSTGELMGTAAYLAPEQVRGKHLGHPVDIYALGLVLLECLTGYREYEGSEVESAVARLHRQPDIPRTLPADLVRLLTRMTALSPRRRPTALYCARVLGDGEGTTKPVRRTDVRKGVLAGVATVVLGGVGIAWALSGESPATSAPPGGPSSGSATSGPAAVTGSSAGSSAGSSESADSSSPGVRLTGGEQPAGNPTSGSAPTTGTSIATTTTTTAPLTTETETGSGKGNGNTKEPPGQVKKSTTTTATDSP
ncbi:MAG: serine/threonine-protein kinase [Umezawaea sp.]